MIREWVTLLRLARRRWRSNDDYRRFQIYQGNLLLNYLVEQGISIRDTEVLDVACGIGGYGYTMASAGAHVISIDLGRPKMVPLSFVLADAVQLPFGSNYFPVVFCASLIEHVPDPAHLLAEIKRVLTPGGIVYLSFPPFYTPIGGHQFKPYHLLGERWALRLSGQEADSFATACGDWGLYPLTIRRVRQLISEAGLRIRHESTRYFPLNLARLPWLGEFLTWHVQFILSEGSWDSSYGNEGAILVTGQC
jgi:SAM-dependent methyltransferase